MKKNFVKMFKDFKWKFSGIPICIEAFRIIHGITVGALRHAKTWAMADETLRQMIDARRRDKQCNISVDMDSEDKFLGGTEQSLTTCKWIAEYAELHGCKMPDTVDVHIDDIPWLEIHAEYKEDVKSVINALQRTQFRNIWRKNFAHVKKRKRKPFGECTDCAGFKRELKELRKDPQERLKVMALYRAHLEHQTAFHAPHRVYGGMCKHLPVSIAPWQQGPPTRSTLPSWENACLQSSSAPGGLRRASCSAGGRSA